MHLTRPDAHSNLAQLARGWRSLDSAWLAGFVLLCLFFSSGRLPNTGVVFLIALGGLLRMRTAAVALPADAVVPAAAATWLAAFIVLADVQAAIFLGVGHRISPQAGLLMCIAPLAALMRANPRSFGAVAALALALAVWHVFALPFEGITGRKIGWNVSEPIAREAGPLRFQAAGLAHQAYYFAGLFLPLFYLALGEAAQRGVGRRWCIVAAALWVVVVACVQSRSAVFGAAAACVLVALAGRETSARRWRTWAAALAAIVLFGAVYLLLFHDNKSGPGLRWIYFSHYVRSSFDGWGLILGHGFTLHPAAHMMVPPQPLSHSHSDIAQVLYAWGLPALVAYAVLLASIARVAWMRWREGQYGYLWALVALAPNLVTDLGIHHYEKAAFLVLLAGMAAAARARTPPRTG